MRKARTGFWLEREKEFPGEMDGLADDLLIEAEAQRIELEGYADLMPGLEEA